MASPIGAGAEGSSGTGAGVLGDEESAYRDSFGDGLLDHPHYTRPAEFRGMKVPDVLLSGNHEAVSKWRRRESLKATLLKRPDLLKTAELTDEDRKIVEERSGKWGSETEAPNHK
jgi:tRNA (guanine37-N1)-methyltransferase